MSVVEDPRVPFEAFFVKARTKTEQRAFMATHALEWLRFQHARRVPGCVMLDIDDTLIDGHEKVVHGFEFMHAFYKEAACLYPVHIVTARPDDCHRDVMALLCRLGFAIPPDRLHMLPERLYGQDLQHVVDFKWRTCVRIGQQHGGVVARLGDKLWDVAHPSSLSTYLKHVDDRACYLFMDPALKGTYSGKLPGL
jgi:hypothetical protein